MEPLNRRDVLAANLLFVTLALSVVQLARPFLAGLMYRDYLPSSWAYPLSWQAVAALLVMLLIRAGLYYAIRHGILFAKLLVALGFLVMVWAETNLKYGLVAGVSFSHGDAFTLWVALPTLLDRLLTLAALALMFWPVRKVERRA
ncbi:MAG: hypothetical protein ACRYFX_09245 [Janthinobacterium lividum]